MMMRYLGLEAARRRLHELGDHGMAQECYRERDRVVRELVGADEALFYEFWEWSDAMDEADDKPEKSHARKPSGHLHTCCVCGKVATWGPGWAWFWRFVWCSDACEEAFCAAEIERLRSEARSSRKENT